MYKFNSLFTRPCTGEGYSIPCQHGLGQRLQGKDTDSVQARAAWDLCRQVAPEGLPEEERFCQVLRRKKTHEYSKQRARW